MPIISHYKRKSQNLSTAIEAIYGLRMDDEADKCLQLASETFLEMLDFDLDSIMKMELDAFLSAVEKWNYSISFLENSSKFIFEIAEVFKSMGRENEMQNLNEKGLLLLKYISQNDKTYSVEREELINQLSKQ
jgi:hypothetical protein